MLCIAEQSPAVEAVFVSASQFVTASPEGVLKVWRIKGGISTSVWTDASKMVPVAVLRGHEDTANHLCASAAWSVLVSCSEDGSAIVWDTNKFRFIRRLVVEPSEPVRAAAVDDATVSQIGRNDQALNPDNLSCRRVISPCSATRTSIFLP